MSTTKDTLNRYIYKTDSASGSTYAETLEEAYCDRREDITDAEIEDGATLWVEDADGNRLTMGIDRK